MQEVLERSLAPSHAQKVFPINFYRSNRFDLQALLKIIPNARAMFDMPGNRDRDIYIMPVSGGADSTALAIVLHLLFPDYPFKIIFTDTLDEDPEIYETLDSLEKYLGKYINRIIPDLGLFDLVRKYNGFLPSVQQRWCTRQLKLDTFKPWLAQFDGIQKYMAVGIRSDESERIAFTINQVETSMPFVDMKVTREQVFAILEQSIGIPKLYRRRSRSGCKSCFFQRRSELVGLYQERPSDFEAGSQMEKIDPINEGRHAGATPLWRDSGISLNWQTLPLPTSEKAITGRKPKRVSMPLFGDQRGVFVGVEYFYDSFCGLDEFTWHRRVVSYSPTRAGLITQLDDRYQHLLATGQVYQMSPDDVRNNARFGIFYVELPTTVFDPDPPIGQGYTWQKGTSYQQLKHIIEWTTRALQYEGMRQQSVQTCAPLTVQEEWVQASKEGLAKITEAVGSVVVSEWYRPTEVVREMTIEEEVSLMPCPACSI